MIDISEKKETLRTARAESRILAKKATIDRAITGDTPKGDVLNVAKAVACLAAKKTSELIPYCHPLLIDAVTFTSEHKDSELILRVEVKTIAKTGVEMEALTAVSLAALTVYDMLKGIDKDVVIGETRLIEKQGGKSDYVETFLVPLKAAVLVTSDSVSAGKKPDKSGKTIVEEMKKFPVEVRHYEIVSDDQEKIRAKILGWREAGIDLILTTGGTGLGPRDVTVEAVKGLIERDIPGVSETMRAYGQKRTPYAMLSRGAAGFIGKTLVITLPGSARGAKECLTALFPSILHVFNMVAGGGH